MQYLLLLCCIGHSKDNWSAKQRFHNVKCFENLERFLQTASFSVVTYEKELKNLVYCFKKNNQDLPIFSFGEIIENY